MAYLVFSRKYRPQNFDELWAQDHVKLTLKNAVATGRIAHAYLFAGPRGVGKTTTARILAKSLNCEHGPTANPCGQCPACQEITLSRSLDVLEIDGASNRRIDEIRDLRENIKYTPARGKYKIYIIDEVHMLTPESFNALLKTLEEPPAHAIFIFATTAPQKVPLTIQSRCQRFDFRRVSVDEIVQRLRWIIEQEKLKITEDAVYAVARRAEGSIRDAESILDQVSAYCSDEITLKGVEELLGMVPGDIYLEYTRLLKNHDHQGLIKFVNRILDQGYDLMEFYFGLLAHFRQLLMLKLGVDPAILGLSTAERKQLNSLGADFSQGELIKILDFLYLSEETIKRSLAPTALLEVVSLHLARMTAAVGQPGSAPQTSAAEQPAAAEQKTGATVTRVKADSTSESSADSKKESGADSGNESEVDVHTVWLQLVDQLRTKRPALASSLELATPTRLETNQLYAAIPEKPAMTKKIIDEAKPVIDKTLSLILKRPVTTVFETKAANGQPEKIEPMVKRIIEIFDGEEIGR